MQDACFKDLLQKGQILTIAKSDLHNLAIKVFKSFKRCIALIAPK